MINQYRFGVTYHADAITYFAAVATAGGTLTDPMKVKISNGITYLDGTGDWALIDRLHLLKSDSEIAALISLKNPASAVATVVNSPTFTAGVGYAFNGTTQYLNSQYDASVDATNYVLDSCWMGRGIVGNANGVYVDMGVRGINAGNPYAFIEDPTAGIFYWGLNSALFDTSLVSTTDSHTHAKRISSSDVDGYKAGTNHAGATASTSIPDLKMYVAAMNNVGTPQYHKPSTFTWYGMGGAVNTDNMNTAFDTYFL